MISSPFLKLAAAGLLLSSLQSQLGLPSIILNVLAADSDFDWEMVSYGFNCVNDALLTACKAHGDSEPELDVVLFRF
jgi:hypothetical protein